LIALYLGSDVTELLMKEAESGRNSITFDGNNKNFPFDKYVGKLKQYFIDLNGTDLPKACKIRKLMDSLNVTGLGNIYPIIKASPEYRNDFERTVVHVQDMLAALGTKHAGKRSISFAKKKEPQKRTKKIKFNHGISGPKVTGEVEVVVEAMVEEEVGEEEVTVNQPAPNLIPTTLASTSPRRHGSS
jgi:hypothetical protein